MKKGDIVRLKEHKRTAKIEILLGGNYGGGVELDKPLCGYRYWNKDDLEKVESPK